MNVDTNIPTQTKSANTVRKVMRITSYVVGACIAGVMALSLVSQIAYKTANSAMNADVVVTYEDGYTRQEYMVDCLQRGGSDIAYRFVNARNPVFHWTCIK